MQYIHALLYKKHLVGICVHSEDQSFYYTAMVRDALNTFVRVNPAGEAGVFERAGKFESQEEAISAAKQAIDKNDRERAISSMYFSSISIYKKHLIAIYREPGAYSVKIFESGEDDIRFLLPEGFQSEQEASRAAQRAIDGFIVNVLSGTL